MPAGRLVATTMPIEQCQVPVCLGMGGLIAEHALQHHRGACRLAALEVRHSALYESIDSGLDLFYNAGQNNGRKILSLWSPDRIDERRLARTPPAQHAPEPGRRERRLPLAGDDLRRDDGQRDRSLRAQLAAIRARRATARPRL